VTVGVNGEVYVTGYSSATNGYPDYATIAYSGAGLPLWTNRYNGPGDIWDQANAIAVGANGNVYVTGYSNGGVSSGDYATIAYSSEGVPLWTNRYNELGGSDESASSVAIDANGNVYVTGYSSATNGYSDYATIAYSSVGIPLWTNRYNGPGNNRDQANAVTVGTSGNIYVSGFSYSSSSSSSSDYATIAYSGVGVPLWTNRYNGPGNGGDFANALGGDANGNVYVIGTSSATNGYSDFATIAYSGAGMPLWTNRYDGLGNKTDQANAVATGTNGNIYVTGFATTSGGSADCATIAYSGAGVPLWTNIYNGPGSSTDQAKAVAVSANGNIYVTGFAIISGGSADYATIAYSGSGVTLWTNLYSGPSSTDQATGVAVGANSNVYVTGSSITSGGYLDYATIAYSEAGVPLWTNRYNGPGNYDDRATALAVGTSGNVYVTGYSYSSFSSSSSDYATIAYSGAGVPLWTNRYNGPGNYTDQANAVAVGTNGNVFVTGYSYRSSTAGTEDYATIAYSGAGVPLWTNRYNGPGNSYDFATDVAVGDNGNVYVTGSSYAVGSTYDFATIAYSGMGVPLWTNRYNEPGNGSDIASAVAVGANGSVYVTGYSFKSGSSYDYATLAYSGTGVPLWTNRYNGPANSEDRANAVVVDTNGNVYVTGYSYGNGSSDDYATIAYSGAGVPLWTNRYNGPANGSDHPETKQSLAIAPDGVLVVGSSVVYLGSGNTVYEYAIVKYTNAVSTGTGANPFTLNSSAKLGNGLFQFGFTNGSGVPFTVLSSTNIALPLNQWLNLGPAVETPSSSGQFQFTDPQATNHTKRFYRVRSP
jgi:uncharacterized delta-60 repeat protein